MPAAVRANYQTFPTHGMLGAPRQAAREKLGLPSLPENGIDELQSHPCRARGRGMSLAADIRTAATADVRQPRRTGRARARGVGRRRPGPASSAPGRAYREEAEQRILGGCGLMGVCDQSGARMSGELGPAQHGLHARPGQRPGRRVRRLRHLPRAAAPVLLPSALQRRRGQGRHRVLSQEALPGGHGRAHPHQAHPRHRGRAHPVALLPGHRRGAAARDPAERRGLRGPRGHGHQHLHRRRLRRLLGQEHGRVQGRRASRRRSGSSSASTSTRAGPGPATAASPPTPRAGGAGPIPSPCSTTPSCTTARSAPTASTSATWRCSATSARCRPTPRWSPICSTSCSGGTDCPWR